ncbi:hypothetical protein K6119_15225 [Paracrocinitomix mangrovi]|uniref:hypothetical protein n=1 Tax=Paracrocinitomix mangrovi TaxID=2862509 RepID=UPI001C8EA7A6|nr:hypothetical protein [Paracrocinitomix mangrovi]UKN01081.1 hypothetical protein K6119_15225 [Paracrocinitomix mangrovi]
MKILVFKTNINTSVDLEMVDAYLSDHTLIDDWSVDIEDIDKVLRVVSSSHLIADEINHLINGLGYQCSELST